MREVLSSPVYHSFIKTIELPSQFKTRLGTQSYCVPTSSAEVHAQAEKRWLLVHAQKDCSVSSPIPRTLGSALVLPFAIHIHRKTAVVHEIFVLVLMHGYGHTH